MQARVVDGWLVTSDGRISHFKERELYVGTNWAQRLGLTGVQEALVDLLEAMRIDVNRAIRITSGIRTRAANNTAGGDPASLHLTGGAADAKPVPFMPPWNLVPSLEHVTLGGTIGRWGIYHREAGGHFHLDVDRERVRRRFVVIPEGPPGAVKLKYFDVEDWIALHFPGIMLEAIPAADANRLLGF